ncbi:MAG TPA: FtsX-like permease family protein [Armatimonadota bacterium]|nr:FtsX-like permease family protein [Armatimonadota bacterium]
MSENERIGGVLEGVGGRGGIEQQIVLPWSRALQMTRENIFVRLGRSAITASGICLGIAFLTAVLFGASASRLLAEMDLERLGVEHEAGELQARIIWLAAMSLVVATVGIVNSMLMSVTERYKEIGTMKCLGALDTFIVRLFLLEAGLLGVLGSAVGAIVGSGVMMLVYLGRLGGGGVVKAWVTTAVQLGGGDVPLWAAITFSVLIGGVLSILAALYPAWRAAKMPPAAALRSEF